MTKIRDRHRGEVQVGAGVVGVPTWGPERFGVGEVVGFRNVGESLVASNSFE